MNREVLTPEVVEKPIQNKYFYKVKDRVNQELKEKPITFNLKKINDNKQYHYNTYNYSTTNNVNKGGLFYFLGKFVLFIVLLPYTIIKGIWNYLDKNYDLGNKIKIEKAKEKFLRFKTKVNKRSMYCDEIM